MLPKGGGHGSSRATFMAGTAIAYLADLAEQRRGAVRGVRCAARRVAVVDLVARRAAVLEAARRDGEAARAHPLLVLLERGKRVRGRSAHDGACGEVARSHVVAEFARGRAERHAAPAAVAE